MKKTRKGRKKEGRGVVMGHGERCNTLPKRDFEIVNNLLENIFLGPVQRPTNPP